MAPVTTSLYELVITAIPFASMSDLSRGTGKDKVMSGFSSGPCIRDSVLFDVDEVLS